MSSRQELFQHLSQNLTPFELANPDLLESHGTTSDDANWHLGVIGLSTDEVIARVGSGDISEVPFGCSEAIVSAYSIIAVSPFERRLHGSIVDELSPELTHTSIFSK